MTTTNALLQDSELPAFEQFKPADIEPALTELIDTLKSTIAAVLATEARPSFANLIRPIEAQERRLDNAWALFSHLNNVQDSPELRAAYGDALAVITQFSTWMGQHKGLFAAYQSIRDQDGFADLSAAEQAAVERALLNFRLNGIALSEQEQKQFAQLKTEIAALQQKFSEQLLDATQAWTKTIDKIEQLAGLPATALATLKQNAEKAQQQGWVISLEAPSMLPVLTYADDRALREEVYRANTTKASDVGPNAGEYDNGPLMTAILEKRQQLASLLGYANFAEMSLATKMAESPAQVVDFLAALAAKAVPQARQEYAELAAFARDHYQLADLQPWDIAYVAEKFKEQRFAISQEELRIYFAVPKVLAGLFATATRLFDIEFAMANDFQRYHPDVQLYNVFENGQLIARFFLDLYARDGKRSGAWMDDCRAKVKLDNNHTQIPVAYLTCNFTLPVADQPSLLTHQEVTTLFHEFGHGLHHMLTRVDVKAVSGISGVAWDAVELPSQFLENWCWETEGLALMSGHLETAEPLPKTLLDNLLAAKNFQSAMAMVRQLEFALFDMRLYSTVPAPSVSGIQELLEQVRAEVAVVPTLQESRFQNSFAHIFAGGYAAGYYSYKWAEVLSADAFSRFEEEGVFNAQTGADFRNSILAMGGSQPADQLYRKFRGRDASIDALLRHNGIAESLA